MNFPQIYKQRFNNSDFRIWLWQILVKNYFQSFFNQDDIVLDIPCGYGEFINALKVNTKIAIDINSDSKEHLKNGIRFIKSSSIKIPLSKNSVNKIFVSNFFEHLSRREIGKTIKEFYRILKKGGEILVLQPNIRFCSKNYWMFFDHITPIDDRALNEVFTSYGFISSLIIKRFLPYSTKSFNIPKNELIIKLYLKLPLLWNIFGRQSFLIYKKI